jgi:hypothetical protein
MFKIKMAVLIFIGKDMADNNAVITYCKTRTANKDDYSKLPNKKQG